MLGEIRKEKLRRMAQRMKWDSGLAKGCKEERETGKMGTKQDRGE